MMQQVLRSSLFGQNSDTIPMALKHHLVMKQEHEKSAKQWVHISVRGKLHLGVTFCSRAFTEEYASNKVYSPWFRRYVTCLAEVATTKLPAACCLHTWSIQPLVMPLKNHSCPDLLLLLENVIHEIIPSIHMMSGLRTSGKWGLQSCWDGPGQWSHKFPTYFLFLCFR